MNPNSPPAIAVPFPGQLSMLEFLVEVEQCSQGRSCTIASGLPRREILDRRIFFCWRAKLWAWATVKSFSQKDKQLKIEITEVTSLNKPIQMKRCFKGAFMYIEDPINDIHKEQQS